MASASYTRDDMILECSNSTMERGDVTDKTIQLSDSEDEKNPVNYSYIDKHEEY